ncbi:MAG: hypothetical protein ABJC12_01410 [Saprospiraceae bacterium]
MNEMINNFLLRIALSPSFLFRKYGVDQRQLKTILTTKLTMDDRRPSGFRKNWSREKNKEISAATLITMFVSLLMGGVFIMAFQITNDVTRMTVYFSLFIIMLSLFLITDFTHVLIDVRDNFIILPKPVSATTFLSARLLHILIHISKILIPLSIPGIIAVLVNYGIWGVVVFVPVMLLLTLFTIFIVNASYLLILQVFTPEKFKSIITMVQIGFTILLYASFQLLPRIMDRFGISEFNISHSAYAWIIPSYWFAGAWKFFYSFSGEPAFIVCTLISIFLPFFSIWLVVKYFAPTFQRKLSLLNTSSGSDNKPAVAKNKNGHTSLQIISRLAWLFTSRGVERASFLFCWKLMTRSREFKMKVYPQFGYMIVLIALLFFRQKSNNFFSDVSNYHASDIFQILTTIYLCSIVFIGAIYQIPYSDSFRANWVYFSPPIDKPGKIISGAIKSGLLQFCVPMILAVLIIVLILKGPDLIPNLLFGFSNVILICVLFARIVAKKLPFSMSPQNAIDGSTSSRRILMFLTIPIFGVPHYFVFHYPVIEGILTVISLGASIFLLNSIKNLSWSSVTLPD